ncbi:aminoacetone oxidase family FAD-binding enzyme [Candidatus Uhrbacteria bacterium]|nr:aminoacetone oxidase family FAD-binding enzyme [Candidatus Uhrbacteria bacterium]
MKIPSKYYDVIVVGGGAAGMIAAGVAAARGKHVLLLEKNASLGEKLKITGGGRCNITNAEYDPHVFLKHYGEAEKFLYSSFSQFGVPETFQFFESRGLPLVVQARSRVFPKTERAYDVFKTLKRNCEKMGVEVRTGCAVKKIIHAKDKIVGVETEQGILRAKSFIVATGGISHPETGSTGNGLQWLKDLGHTVKAPTPTIVPLRVADAWAKSLAGVSLSFMRITFFCEGKKQFSKLGKVLFTHFGLSGPLILNCAGEVSDLLQDGRVTATIDAFPDTDLGSLEKQIVKIFNANKNKALSTVFKLIAPDGTAEAIATLLPDIHFTTKVHSVTKESRKKIVDLLKALPVTITSLMGYDRAVVADGGVVLPEIDQRTMRSKRFHNLYIIGDLLHINRPSGGFSLQLCWTTGYVAGSNV